MFSAMRFFSAAVFAARSVASSTALAIASRFSASSCSCSSSRALARSSTTLARCLRAK